jgi:hypothetical protein
MKTLLLIITFAALLIYGGQFAISLHTRHKARAWALLYLLGKRFTVQFEMSPLWAIAEPVGGNVCCDRIYSVNVRISK